MLVKEPLKAPAASDSQPEENDEEDDVAPEEIISTTFTGLPGEQRRTRFEEEQGLPTITMKWDVGYLPPQRQFVRDDRYKERWKPIIKLGQHHDTVTRCRFSPNGRLLCSASSDGGIKVFDIVTGNCIGSSIVHTSGINDFCWHGDSKYIHTASSDGISHCIAVNQLSLQTSPGISSKSHVFNPSSAIIGSVKHHSSDTPQSNDCKNASNPHSEDGYDQLYDAVMCTSCPNFSGQYFLTGGYDEVIKKWDIRKLTSFISDVRAHDGPITTVEHSSDDRLFITSSLDGQARLWTTEDLEPLRSYNGNDGIPLAYACFSPSGRNILCIPLESNPRIWSVPCPKEFLNLVSPPFHGSAKSESIYEAYCVESVPDEATSGKTQVEGNTEGWQQYTPSSLSSTRGISPVEFLSSPGPCVYATFYRDLIFIPQSNTVLGQNNSGVHIWRSTNGRYVGWLSSKVHDFSEITSTDAHPCNSPLIATSSKY